MENEEIMSTTDELETVVSEANGSESVEIAINKLFAKAFTSMKMVLRIPYLMAITSDVPEKAISFSRINSVLHANIEEGDYNYIPDINSLDDLYELHNNIMSAASGITPWCKRVCKDCGKEFSLYLSEVDFYRGKGFALPKRCKNCLKNHKESQTTT